MNNVACYRLGTMLHLEIQKGGKAMKTLTFQNDIGGTATYMKRIMINKKGCGQLNSNDTYFSDSWFSSVITAEEAMTDGVDYCELVKTSHKAFCLAIIQNVMKYWPGGSDIVMSSTPIVPVG